MKYIDEIKQKLSDYKKEKFPELDDGIWKKNKQRYSHIIPESERYYNLLPAYRDNLVKYIETQNVKLHIDFHHLNSSQAMCLNFFYPLITEKRLDIILDLLNFYRETVDYSTVCFEKDGIEKSYGRRPTSFDFYLETKSGKKLYFEIKYTESEFGKAKNDKEHIEKFEEIYSGLLNPIREEFHSKDRFFENYQILRNLIHLTENSFVIFLYPNNNLKIKNQAENAKMSMLKNDFKDNFYPITWEEIYKKVTDNSEGNRLSKQLFDFKEKYLR